jgi:hypothetical protein
MHLSHFYARVLIALLAASNACATVSERALTTYHQRLAQQDFALARDHYHFDRLIITNDPLPYVTGADTNLQVLPIDAATRQVNLLKVATLVFYHDDDAAASLGPHHIVCRKDGACTLPLASLTECDTIADDTDDQGNLISTNDFSDPSAPCALSQCRRHQIDMVDGARSYMTVCESKRVFGDLVTIGHRHTMCRLGFCDVHRM